MAALELMMLSAAWGASFLFLRVAAPHLGPFTLIALRVGVAACMLLPVLRSASVRRQWRGNARHMLVFGTTGAALPFTLYATASLQLGAGFESVLNATTPLWAAVIGAGWFGAPLRRPQVAGLILGWSGVILLVGLERTGGVAMHLGLVALALLASMCYGFSIQYARRHLSHANPVLTTFGSQASAFMLLALPALLTWPSQAVAWQIWLCAVALGMLCTGFAYVLFFRLVARAGAAYAASSGFLVPVFGMLWGHIFLREAVTLPMLAGCALILLGTWLAKGRLEPAPAPRP